MRDLRRYPVTTAEIAKLCRDLADQFAKEERVGDMRPLLLRGAAQIVSRSEFPTFDLNNAK